jgi:dnd system-associated protein 4
MEDGVMTSAPTEKSRDRFYVQKDKHVVFQRLSQDDAAPFTTMKDAWLLACALGYRARRRKKLEGGTQHVGFWHYLSPQEDIPFLQALAIAETNSIAVLADRDQVIRIAEEYANAGIDLLEEEERHDRQSTLRALATMIIETSQHRGDGGPEPAASPAEDAETLIRGGESARVEFKATARWNPKTRAKDKALEEPIVATITGFLNSSGGTLFIGVSDDGKAAGLADDLTTVKRQNRDGFELWIHDLCQRRLGAAATAHIDVTFPVAWGTEVCRVDVGASANPVFIDGDPWFHVRLGNSTRRMSAEEATKYMSEHWPG